jgi:Gpi18-like mannosyltransferase
MENTPFPGRAFCCGGPFLPGKKETMRTRKIGLVILALVLALALRVYFVPAPGYERDIQLFKIWGENAARHGLHQVYDKTWCDYPPGYLYVLKAVGHVYCIFYPDFKEDTYLFNFLIKFPPILADVLTAFVLFLFLRKKYSFRIGFLAMLAYAFNPVIFFNSAWWGQADAVPLLLALLAVLLLINNRLGWAWGLLAVSILVKTQMFILLPVFVLVTWKRRGFSALAGSMAFSWAAFILVVFPFLLSNKVDRVVERILDAVGAYPYLSMNAYNLWWLLSWGRGRSLPDTDLFLGLISYRTLGTLLLGAFILVLVRYLFAGEKDEEAVFLSCALAFLAFFMLPTEMHERYIFPVFAFLLLAAAQNLRLRIAYGILSLSAFFNLYLSVLRTYPQNFPGSASFWQAFPMDIMVSVIHLLVFVYFAHMILKGIKKKQLVYFSFAVLFLFGSLYFVKRNTPLHLSDLEPVSYRQEWGGLQRDRSTDGNRLKVNGFYFAKGLGTHARSQIVYNLRGRYRVLEGGVGLDDEQNRGNKIEFWIYADQRLLYQSGLVQGRKNPRYFTLPVEGVRELRLEVGDGGDGINFDHADWLGLKVLP